MPDLDQKIERFTSAILQEAAAENERKLAQLQQKRKAALSAAEDLILLDSYNFVHSEVSRIHTDAGKRVSQHALEQKRALAVRRKEITEEVFAGVTKRLRDFTASPQYAARLSGLFRDAIRSLEGAKQARLYLRKEDMPLAGQLTALAPDVEISVLEGDFRLGGIVLDAPALGLRVDSTFDGMLRALDSTFAELFGQAVAESN
ncbi:MAG: V-type ATP synthase subunit E [Oscillospiraceae bacterium]|nr:V-type ATP synthase subunit E [Oscillospiraceae bacterium]